MEKSGKYTYCDSYWILPVEHFMFWIYKLWKNRKFILHIHMKDNRSISIFLSKDGINSFVYSLFCTSVKYKFSYGL